MKVIEGGPALITLAQSRKYPGKIGWAETNKCFCQEPQQFSDGKGQPGVREE